MAVLQGDVASRLSRCKREECEGWVRLTGGPPGRKQTVGETKRSLGHRRAGPAGVPDTWADARLLTPPLRLPAHS